MYDARLEYYISRDEDRLQDRIVNCAAKYRDTFSCWGIDAYYSRHPERKNIPFAVFGAGNMGRQTVRTLNLLGLKIDCIIDNNQDIQNKECLGYTVMPPNYIKGRKVIVIVAVRRVEQINIYYQLLNLGVSEDMIIMHQEGGLYLDYGSQYFDVEDIVPTQSGEFFLDAGCFDGLSSVNAARWAKGKLKKVYAFKLDNNSIAVCEENLKRIGCDYIL